MAKRKKSEVDEMFRQMADLLRQAAEIEVEKKDLQEQLEGYKITLDVWRMTHPVAITCGSDVYYAKTAEEIRQFLNTKRYPKSIPPEFTMFLALTLTAYLEDLKSDLGVWSAFRSLYKEQYGSLLPFYDTDHDDYFEDDLNLEDIKYLIWQVCSRVNQTNEIMYSPFSQINEDLGPKLMDMLVERFDDAPKSTRLRSYIANTLKTDDYIKIREIAYWLTAQNPLISVPFKEEEVLNTGMQVNEKLIDKGMPVMPDYGPYVIRAEAAWSKRVGPLGIPSTRYVAQLARQFGLPRIAAKLASFQVAIERQFNVTEITSKFIYCEDALGCKYNVLRSSMLQLGNELGSLKAFTSQLVKYGDEWNVNGMLISLNEKVTEADQMQADDSIGTLQRADELIKEYGGQQVFCCRNMKQVCKILKVPEQEAPDADNFLLILSRQDGIHMYPNMAQFITAEGNRLLRKREARDKSLMLIGMGIADDVAQYIVDNHLLDEACLYASQGEEFGHRLLQENLRFFFAFYRTHAADISDTSEQD